MNERLKPEAESALREMMAGCPVNNSGIQPLDVKCLVIPDPVEEKIGNIILPDAVKEKEEWKRQRCTLVAVGASAFAEWGADKPKVGDRVFLSQYSGTKIEVSNETYWLINDEDIVGAIIRRVA